MADKRRQVDIAVDALEIRAKELNCIYQSEEVLINYNRPLQMAIMDLIDVIPNGWQYPDICVVRVKYKGRTFQSPNFSETPWQISAYLEVQNVEMGSLEVFYTKQMPVEYEGPFQLEEKKLVISIARRLGDFIQHQNMQKVLRNARQTDDESLEEKIPEWRIVVELSRSMDQDLYIRIARLLLNYLCWNGIEEANIILQQISSDSASKIKELTNGENQPTHGRAAADVLQVSSEIFLVATRHLSDEEILFLVRKWMQEDRASFLSKTLVNLNSSLGDITDAIRRFVHLAPEGIDLSLPTLIGLRVSLVRRLITDQLDYIRIAKSFVDINDFSDLIQRMIFPSGSHGQVGGKSAGLFLAAKIIGNHAEENPQLKHVKTPKTWYVTSDGLHNFMRSNNLEEVTEQKYKEIGQVRREYPHIIQLFKNSQITPDIVQGLSMALDDFGEVPIIVRSSSLLEDRFGSAFSGKYKSLFLANQGKKSERLKALMDAIAEVYASTFGPDPIEYRSERGLIDFKEEMGIIIQEVVGTAIGKYFLPAYAGVAFSSNEFRWSPRIKREDGLVRIVPGLGTRAVDRLSDDYPVLVAPGQPGLRVNVSLEEILRYSPKKMDVINIEDNCFETIDVIEFFKKHGNEFPASVRMVSMVKDDKVQVPSILGIDFEDDEFVVNFEGLMTKTPFLEQVDTILKLLQDTMGTPVDIEFASDDKDFYLLQCRPQSYSEDNAPAPIPKDIPERAILFTANKYISNGFVPDISHIVYVDPDKYANVDDLDTLVEIGRLIGVLNKMLPKRQYILVGPGRWGSRGDIKLGVNVTYSDISNTAVLIEVAMKTGNYVPDLSFGTHFFQDLVEASIRYLPLYPDDEKVVFNADFFDNSPNILNDLAPDYVHLADLVRVIDVPAVTDGKIVRISMNADLEEAVAILSQPSSLVKKSFGFRPQNLQLPANSGEHWRWRSRMASNIAENLDPERFGVEAMYIFGSTKNATARPCSDIDILMHFTGSEGQKKELVNWLDGWSLCLDEMNYLKTGHRCGGLLDVHLITDKDLVSRNNFASKIGAVTDAAKEIPLKKKFKL